MSCKAILLMFLGGFPCDNNDSDNHWFNFFQTRTNNLYIVVHPQSIEEDDDNYKKLKKTIAHRKDLRDMYSEGKFLIVDENHHCETKWATFSLVSATLLMMQYALTQKGNIFKKMVLLDSTHAPLYNCSIIEEELASDSKSWFYFGSDNEGYRKDTFKKMYDYEGGIFSINDATYMSQWFAIDNIHLNFFLDMNASGYITYKKKGQVNCNKGGRKTIDIIMSISSNSKYQKFIEAHAGSGDSSLKMKITKDDFEGNIFETGYCITGDESFFGTVFKYHCKTNEDLVSNVKTENITNLNNRVVYQAIIPNIGEDFFLRNKYIYVNHVKPKDKKQYTANFGCWYGSMPKFNKLNLKYRIYLQLNGAYDKSKPDSIDNSKYLTVKNGKLIGITNNIYQKLTNSHDVAVATYESLEGGTKEGDTIINIEDRNTTFKHEVFEGIYTVCSTFTDWSVVSVNPANMTRGLNTCYFHKDFSEGTDCSNLSFFRRNPIDEITDDTRSTLDFINSLLEQSSNLSTKVTKGPYVTGPGYHPIEYGTYKLRDIVNTLNTIIFFDLTNDELKFNKEFKQAKRIYNTIIDDVNDVLPIIESYETRFYIIKDGFKHIEKQEFGFPITSHVLNNALHYGALFIRKVLKTSKIHEYSNQLYGLTTYVPKMNLVGFHFRDPLYKSINNFAQAEWSELTPIFGGRYKADYFKLKQKYVTHKNFNYI